MVKEALVVSLALVLQEKTIRFMIISFFLLEELPPGLMIRM